MPHGIIHRLFCLHIEISIYKNLIIAENTLFLYHIKSINKMPTNKNAQLRYQLLDRQLYAKYGLSDDEIAFIEKMIKPMG